MNKELYILGLILTDGYKYRNYYRIELKDEDKNVLKDIENNYDCNLYHRTRDTNFAKNYSSTILEIRDKELRLIGEDGQMLGIMSAKAALELAELLNKKLRPKKQKESFPIHVNLIPVNPVNETEFSASDKSAVEKFAATLERKGIRATIRRRLGSDINASCGQLRRERS